VGEGFVIDKDVVRYANTPCHFPAFDLS